MDTWGIRGGVQNSRQGLVGVATYCCRHLHHPRIMLAFSNGLNGNIVKMKFQRTELTLKTVN